MRYVFASAPDAVSALINCHYRIVHSQQGPHLAPMRGIDPRDDICASPPSRGSAWSQAGLSLTRIDWPLQPNGSKVRWYDSAISNVKLILDSMRVRPAWGASK
jgi:hypothetical protein